MLYQVVEKEGFGVDWALVRYNEKALTRFDDRKKAIEAAVEYVTDRNCNNALTASEKLSNIECFMMTETGCFLGILDGKEWYLTYPKDIRDSQNPDKVVHAKNEVVKDSSFFLLEGKAEVAVRPLPGS